MLDQITPLVLTYNEAPNIDRTLDALDWARDIVVVDSFSTDDTLERVHRRPAVRVLQRKFDSFASQRNFGLEHGSIKTEWVLALDADHVLTRALISELSTLRPRDSVGGYRARFRYCIDGRPLRGSLYPPLVVLFRRDLGRFVQDGHAQQITLRSGEVDWLEHPIHHDDRKPLARWLQSQGRYAAEEAAKLRSTPWPQLGWPDRVRSIPFASAPLALGYALLVKGCALDGVPGLTYAAQRVIAELVLSLELLRSNAPTESDR
jgi:glycosyltransferase involved in cell wall biosynthesis